MVLNQGFEYREQINQHAAGATILDYLSQRYPHSSREQWRDRLQTGRVLVDGDRVSSSAILRPGQGLTWRRPPWHEPEVPLDFAVLYRDCDLLAVAKPCGLPTVPAGGFLEHTLLTRVRRHFPEATPIHRLGRGTSGVVLLACSRRCRSLLTAALRDRQITKIYRALVVGIPEQDRWVIDAPIGPVPHPRLGTLYAASPQGKQACSRVTVLDRGAEASLVEVHIDTGRPHQIRIHLAAAGYPLLGDPLYTVGGGFQEPATALPSDLGYRLHAACLRFSHPTRGEPVVIHCPPPPGLRRETGES